MQPNGNETPQPYRPEASRPVLDPRIAHRRPIVPTAQLDQVAQSQVVQPAATQEALYAREADSASYTRLSSRPQRRERDKTTRLLVIIAVIMVVAAAAVFAFTRFSGGKDSGDSGPDANGGTSGGGSEADAERRADINAIGGFLQIYAQSHNGRYPTYAQINDSEWRAANVPQLTNDLLSDPGGDIAFMTPAPAANSYTYVSSSGNKGDESCDNVDKGCIYLRLTATLSDGSQYTVRQ